MMPMSKENEEGWEDVPSIDISYEDALKRSDDYFDVKFTGPDCMCLACVFKRIWGR